MGETTGTLGEAHEAALSEIEDRWGGEHAAAARDQLGCLRRLAAGLASGTDAAHDTASPHALLEDLVTRLRTVSAQEQLRPLLTEAEVVSALAEALRQAVSLGVPQAGLGLAQPVEVVAQVLGADHPHTLTTRFALASAYRAAGDARQAAAVGEQVVEGTTRLLGPDHPRTLTARHSLASAYRAAGRTQRAVEMYEQLAEDTARLLGGSHPDALSARNNLAQACESAGEPERALALYEELLRDAERALGPQHPYLAVFLRNRERARALHRATDQP